MKNKDTFFRDLAIFVIVVIILVIIGKVVGWW